MIWVIGMILCFMVLVVRFYFLLLVSWFLGMIVVFVGLVWFGDGIRVCSISF